MTRKRRSLVLTSEACRHPFRASLPQGTFPPRGLDRRSGSRFTVADIRDFLSAYVATFVVVSVFIG